MKNIIEGDVVSLNIQFSDLPQGMVDDVDDDDSHEAYFEGMILEIDETNSMIEISFHRIENGQITAWYPISKIKNVSRIYKIMDLVENEDINNGNMTLIADLSIVKKTFFRTSENITYYTSFSETDIDTFIMPLESDLANTMLDFPEDDILIEFDNFRLGRAEFDDLVKDVYYLK